MKIRYLIVLLAILSIFALGCSQTGNSFDQSMMNKEKMMDEEANEIAEIGFEMKNDSMMVIDERAKAMAPMEKEAMLKDGTKVMTDGKVMRKDGTSFMLKEGESIWMDGAFMKAGEMMEDEGMMEAEYHGKVLAGKTTPYLDFNKEDYENALKENRVILLNFYANWCPLCRQEQPEAFAAFNGLNDENIIGFRVNYKDSETDAGEEALAKQFGIAYQHTKVILKDGKQVAKFPDSWDRQRYLDVLGKVQ